MLSKDRYERIAIEKRESGLAIAMLNRPEKLNAVDGRMHNELSTLASALSKHAPKEKRYRDHVREGRQKGVDWETEVPVTDPHGNERRR